MSMGGTPGFYLPLEIMLSLGYFLWVGALLIAKRIGLHWLRRIARRTETKFDDILIRAADFPLTLFILISGGFIIEKHPALANPQLTHAFLVVLKAVVIVSIILFSERLTVSLIKYYSTSVEILKSWSGVVKGTSQVIIYGLGLLILLDSFGISVTPLMASLGIGSLAVALALQPSLENFFSCIQIITDRPVQIGHFIKLESGEEGYVHRIGWRSTWIRMLSNNMVVIPNKSLVSAKIINYYYPESEMAALVEVGVHYGSDLEHVEKITVEVAKEILNEVPGGIKDFQPFIRFHTFDDYSINFSVILRVKEFTDNYLMKHEFIKRLHKRYKKEGIVIPYPIEAVNFEQEKAFENRSSKY